MFLEKHLPHQWKLLLKEEIQKPYFKSLAQAIESAYSHSIIFPAKSSIFNALHFASPEQVKVIIIGQDPYHGPGQANGLSFSVNNGVKLPPSLRNIYKEISSDLGIEMSNNGDLSKWAKQGVLLLNSTLTVKEKSPNSHSKLGWQIFTDAIIKRLDEMKQDKIFLLWGKFAQQKETIIHQHAILKAAHPSPFSAHRGFLGCQHFSKSNAFLVEKGLSAIDWQIN